MKARFGVVAASFQDYRAWMRRMRLSSDQYAFLGSEENVRGQRFRIVFLLDGWQRSCPPSLLNYIKIAAEEIRYDHI
jgi:hypothetical protein